MEVLVVCVVCIIIFPRLCWDGGFLLFSCLESDMFCDDVMLLFIVFLSLLYENY